MEFSVSSLGFPGPFSIDMKHLAPDIGIEIFYEWGGEVFWDLMLKEALQNRTGSFSIHAPFQNQAIDLSVNEDEKWLFDYLRQPFRLYHKYHADGYVVHMNTPYPTEPTAQERSERLKRAEDRLARFHDICKNEGVNMLVENLAFSHGATLCDQADFLGIFERNPELDCIIDTGHAQLAKIDMLAVQQALGSRIKAYHIHDNDGKMDGHQRIRTGVIDWKRFAEGVRLYTPDANLVMEYNIGEVPSVQGYAEDAEYLRRLITGK